MYQAWALPAQASRSAASDAARIPILIASILGAPGPEQLGEVLAHPLDRLFDALVGRRQRDPEEALAARPVHRPRRDDHGRLFEDELGEGGRGVAVGDRRPDVDRPLRGA